LTRYLALALLAVTAPALAQTIPAREDIRILDGECLPDSVISRSVDSGQFRRTPYRCNTAVVSFHETRGSIMIQFTIKEDREAVIVGFAGTLVDRENVNVERVYFGGGNPAIEVNGGDCKLFFEGTRVVEIACAAQIDRGRVRVVPLIGFQVR
jgi:hypothetical protein